nr:hypothetical protein [uncultured Desulfobulbus sp.]
MKIPRILASLLSLIIVIIGLRAVLTGEYIARSGRLGVELILTGPAAVYSGVCVICLGFLPLLLWFSKHRRLQIVLGIGCLIAAAIAYYLSSLYPAS